MQNNNTQEEKLDNIYKIVITDRSYGLYKATLYYKEWYLFWVKLTHKIDGTSEIIDLIKEWKKTYEVADNRIIIKSKMYHHATE